MFLYTGQIVQHKKILLYKKVLTKNHNIYLCLLSNAAFSVIYYKNIIHKLLRTRIIHWNKCIPLYLVSKIFTILHRFTIHNEYIHYIHTFSDYRWWCLFPFSFSLNTLAPSVMLALFWILNVLVWLSSYWHFLWYSYASALV